MSEQLYLDDHKNDCAYCGKDFAEMKQRITDLEDAIREVYEAKQQIARDNHLSSYQSLFNKIKSAVDEVNKHE